MTGKKTICRVISVLLFMWIDQAIYAQTIQLDTILIKGKYFGKDLYVQNPQIIIEKDSIFTAQQVLVNDSLVLNYKQLQINAFAIPLTKLHLKEGETVVIKILQTQFGRVKILNPTIHK